MGKKKTHVGVADYFVPRAKGPGLSSAPLKSKKVSRKAAAKGKTPRKLDPKQAARLAKANKGKSKKNKR